MLRSLLLLLASLICVPGTLADERVHGVLAAGDAFDRVRTNCYADVQPVSMMGGRTYTILLTSMEFDPLVRIESPEGKPLASDDDGAGALHARLVFKAPNTGNYRIVSTSFAARATGRYILEVHEGDWVVDRLFRGSLQLSDPIYRVPVSETPAYMRLPTGSHFDAYPVSMPGVPRPNHYMIHILSKDFAPWLVVERDMGWKIWRWGHFEGAGAQSAHLDAASFGPLSRDEGVPGQYRIIVSSNRADAMGAYVLRVLREVRRP